MVKTVGSNPTLDTKSMNKILQTDEALFIVRFIEAASPEEVFSLSFPENIEIAERLVEKGYMKRVKSEWSNSYSFQFTGKEFEEILCMAYLIAG